MAEISLPFSGSEVRTRAQSEEFMNTVLMPLADQLAECCFETSGIIKVEANQTTSNSDEEFDWTSVGFSAEHIKPYDDPGCVEFCLWEHIAADSVEMPVPKEILARVTSRSLEEGYLGASLLLPDGDELDIDELEEAVKTGEILVVEQREYHIDNRTFCPSCDLNFAYSYYGRSLGMLCNYLLVREFTERNKKVKRFLDRTEARFRGAYDHMDLECMGGILQRLRLLDS